MKKRPLALLCLAAVCLLALIGERQFSARKQELFGVQEELEKAAGAGQRLSLDGTVTACDAVSEGVRLSVDHIIIYAKDHSETFLSSDLQLIMTTENETILPGDRIHAEGKFRKFEEAGNPGQFDAVSYYFASKTIGSLSRAKITLQRQQDGGAVRTLAALRRTLRRSFLRILDEKTAKTAAAICLGEKSWMESETKQLFQEGGIAHIISISGLHVSLIGMGLYGLLRRMRLPFAVAGVPSAAAVGAYALMSGSGVSSVRAFLMFLVWIGAQAAGRKYDMTTAAGLSAFLILVTDPGAFFQASFQLSFGAILSIALLVPYLQKSNPFRMQGRKGSTPVRLGQALWTETSMGVGVWMGTLPVTLSFFYQAAPWSILVNLAVVPLMSAVMGFGLLSCLAGLVCVPAGIFLSAPTAGLLRLFEWLCTLEQNLPGALWVAGRPSVLRMLLYFALLAGAAGMALARTKNGGKKLFRILTLLCWPAAFLSGLFLMQTFPRNGLEVICLDVGQGDGALILPGDGTAHLIDGGSSSESGIWEYRISQTLKYKGVSGLDTVFLSHADGDHTSGITEFLRECRPVAAGGYAHGITVKCLVLPPTAEKEDFQEIRALAQEAGIRVLRMEAGSSLGRKTRGKEPPWSIFCLSPDPEGLTGDKNEDSMVLLLRYGTFRMLFTGDLEGRAEKSLACSEEDLRCDVLKVGHHGSAGASSVEFLEAAAPSFGVISCGKDNRYGHPAKETLRRLADAGISYGVTCEAGAVTVCSDGETFSLASVHGRIGIGGVK